MMLSMIHYQHNDTIAVAEDLSDEAFVIDVFDFTDGWARRYAHAVIAGQASPEALEAFTRHVEAGPRQFLSVRLTRSSPVGERERYAARVRHGREP